MILFASHNADKIAEMRAMLSAVGIDMVSGVELGLPEPEETGSTFEENARLKARAAMNLTGMITIADDSGLCVDALGGRPGVRTADWAGRPRNYQSAMLRVHEDLQAVGALDEEDRTASLVCVICVALPTGEMRTFRGKVEGTISWPPRGDRSHGYDPIFRPLGSEFTFGETGATEPAGWSPELGPARSHRGNAFAVAWADSWIKENMSQPETSIRGD